MTVAGGGRLRQLTFFGSDAFSERLLAGLWRRLPAVCDRLDVVTLPRSRRRLAACLERLAAGATRQQQQQQQQLRGSRDHGDDVIAESDVETTRTNLPVRIFDYPDMPDDAQLAVLASFGRILTPNDISHFERSSSTSISSSSVGGQGGRGVWNVHPSLLPRWRGAAPVPWTLRAGDERCGVTLARLTPRVDAGGVVWQSDFRNPAVDRDPRTPPLTTPLMLDFLADAASSTLPSLIASGRLDASTPLIDQRSLPWSTSPVARKLTAAADGAVDPTEQSADDLWRQFLAFSHAVPIRVAFDSASGVQTLRLESLTVSQLLPRPCDSGCHEDTVSFVTPDILLARTIGFSFTSQSTWLVDDDGAAAGGRLSFCASCRRLRLVCADGRRLLVERVVARRRMSANDFANGYLRGPGSHRFLKLRRLPPID